MNRVDSKAAPPPVEPTVTAATAAPPVKEHASLFHGHRGLVICALIVVGVLVGLGVRWWIGPLVTTASVLRRDFVQSVVATGRVEAPHRLDIGAQITGTVIRVPVIEGQGVSAGDLLIELDAAELQAAARQADAAVAQALARLRQLTEVQAPVAAQMLSQAKSSVENARSSLTRMKELFRKGYVAQAAVDDARKASELADAQMRASQTQFDTTGATGSDRALAMADLSSARASVQTAGARAAYAVIHAPVAGTLIARNVETGDVVQPGNVLMTLSPLGDTQLVVQIDEKNLALLALGQSALASPDAYPTMRFLAQLAYINPGINATTGAVEVKLDVALPPPTLKQDMTVSVDIEVARRPNTLIVPITAVHGAEGPAPWVLRMDHRHAMRTTIHLGLVSGGFAEVTAGLAQGDSVVESPSTISPGARVRVSPDASSPTP